MKKVIIMAITLMFVLSFGITAMAEAPTNELFTANVFWSMDDYTESADPISHSVGMWQFSDGGCTYTKANGQLIVTGNDGITIARLDQGSSFCPGFEIEKDADAVGFYFENNTADACGIAFFGEITNSLGTHQIMYQSTDFEDIKCWLVDMDGNVTAGVEYEEDYGHGLAEVPEGFKGYFIVDLHTLGHDYCHYGNWGDHDTAICENGVYTDDSYLSQVGFAVMSYYDEDTDNFVFDDYMLVTYADESKMPVPGAATAAPTAAPTDAPTDAPSGDATTAPSGDATVAPTDAPNSPAPFPIVPVAIIGGVILVAAVIIIIAVASKKKSA